MRRKFNFKKIASDLIESIKRWFANRTAREDESEYIGFVEVEETGPVTFVEKKQQHTGGPGWITFITTVLLVILLVGYGTHSALKINKKSSSKKKGGDTELVETPIKTEPREDGTTSRGDRDGNKVATLNLPETVATGGKKFKYWALGEPLLIYVIEVNTDGSTTERGPFKDDGKRDTWLSLGACSSIDSLRFVGYRPGQQAQFQRTNLLCR